MKSTKTNKTNKTTPVKQTVADLYANRGLRIGSRVKNLGNGGEYLVVQIGEVVGVVGLASGQSWCGEHFPEDTSNLTNNDIRDILGELEAWEVISL